MNTNIIISTALKFNSIKYSSVRPHEDIICKLRYLI